MFYIMIVSQSRRVDVGIHVNTSEDSPSRLSGIFQERYTTKLLQKRGGSQAEGDHRPILTPLFGKACRQVGRGGWEGFYFHQGWIVKYASLVSLPTVVPPESFIVSEHSFVSRRDPFVTVSLRITLEKRKGRSGAGLSVFSC